MKSNHKLVWAGLVGAVIAIAGTAVIHARQVKVAPAYIIAEVEVTDPATFQKYADQVAGTLVPFNGHYLVRGGKLLSLEGEGEAPQRFVVIAFDSLQKAQGWENSPAYSAIKPIRHKSAKSRVFIAEGIAPQ